MLNKCKKMLNRLYQWDSFPFVILVSGMILLHLTITYGTVDDSWCLDNLVLDKNGWSISSFLGMDLRSYFVYRYQTWSSRLVIEYVALMIISHRILWTAVNIAMVLLIARCISLFFPSGNIRKKNWMITCLMFIFPFQITGDTGWVATSMNYLWVLALGLYAMVSVYKAFQGIRMKWYEYLLCTIALFYAVNAEQMCAVLLAVFLISTIYLLKTKKINIYIMFQTLICAGGMVLVLICPGNALRAASEIPKWFPDYTQLSFMQKTELGYSSSLYEFIMQPNLIFTIFSFLLLISIFLKQKNKILRTIAAIPFATSLIFGLFGSYASTVFPWIAAVKNAMTIYGTGATFASVQSLFPDVLLAMICLSVLFSIYHAFDNKDTGLLAILIVLLGFATRIMMGFSPTIWASGERTFTIMFFSFIICSVMLYNQIMKTHMFKYDHIFMPAITSIAALSYLNILFVAV